jgi:hypothetical protein
MISVAVEVPAWVCLDLVNYCARRQGATLQSNESYCKESHTQQSAIRQILAQVANHNINYVDGA